MADEMHLETKVYLPIFRFFLKWKPVFYSFRIKSVLTLNLGNLVKLLSVEDQKVLLGSCKNVNSSCCCYGCHCTILFIPCHALCLGST